ncbi:MAG: trigger factor, partial [Gammaproteobacteria bacterium]
MQVSVEVMSGLERRLTVELPWAAFEEREMKELKNLQKRAKIPGFRPGKAPLDIVRRNSQDLHHTVAFELMRENIWSAIEQINNENIEAKLNMASQPRFEMPTVEDGHPVKLSFVFEVYPVIDLKDLNGMEVTKLISTLAESDVEQTIEKLRQQMREWHDVTRAAQNDDRIIMDFEGFIDDQAFPGNSAKHFSLELGSKRMIPGFEEALVGAKAGEE